MNKMAPQITLLLQFQYPTVSNANIAAVQTYEVEAT